LALFGKILTKATKKTFKFIEDDKVKPKVRKPKARKPKAKRSKTQKPKARKPKAKQLKTQKPKAKVKNILESESKDESVEEIIELYGDHVENNDLHYGHGELEYDSDEYWNKFNIKEKEIIEQVLSNKGLRSTDIDTLVYMDYDTGNMNFYNLENLPKNVRKFIRKSKLEEDLTDKKAPNYSEEDAVNALRKAATYHFPLSSRQYDHLRFIGEIEGPRSRWMVIKWNGWRNACLNAGIESPDPNTKNYKVRWSDEELWNFFERYYLDPQTTGIRKNYDDWRTKQPDEIPSSTVLKQRLGEWDSVREEFLENLYDQRN
jgi:hypothetical protein